MISNNTKTAIRILTTISGYLSSLQTNRGRPLGNLTVGPCPSTRAELMNSIIILRKQTMLWLIKGRLKGSGNRGNMAWMTQPPTTSKLLWLLETLISRAPLTNKIWPICFRANQSHRYLGSVALSSSRLFTLNKFQMRWCRCSRTSILKRYTSSSKLTTRYKIPSLVTQSLTSTT